MWFTVVLALSLSLSVCARAEDPPPPPSSTPAPLRQRFQEARDRGDRAEACAVMRELVRSAEVSPAQRRVMEQYLASQCADLPGAR